MGNSYFTDPLIFLIQFIFGAYILIVMLRFVLQLVRADFRNPISQFIVKATSPVLNPLRRIIPGFAGMDFSSIVLLWVLKSLELFLIFALLTQSVNFIGPLIWAVPSLIEQAFNLFIFAIIIQVILSWVNQGYSYNPAVSILFSLTNPILRPLQRKIPSFSGLDLSPLVALLLLQLTKMLVIPPLMHITQSPFQ